MKLLLDQGTPRSAATLLRHAGFDTVHTGDIGMATADDAEIIQQAALEGRIVVTLDADFHSLLAQSQAVRPSVIRIRIEGLKAEGFADILLKVLSQCQEDIQAGSLISVRDFQIRIRRLPVV